jgi:hypothetical protein
VPASLIAAVSNPAMAQGGTSALDVLEFAYLLENLEYYFYHHALVHPEAEPLRAMLSTEELAGITLIRDHEEAHVDLLAGAIEANNGTPATYTYDSFDYTAGGTFPTVYTSPAIFLAVSQAFEDTGVRAYKGQAGNLMGNDLLTTALQIHSIEARHAAYIRHLRIMKDFANDDEKEWVTTPDYDGLDGAEAATAPVYENEENVTQLDVDATSVTDVERVYVEEAYDEPLSKEKVTAIASNFIKS